MGQYVDIVWQIVGPGDTRPKLGKSKSVKMST